MLLSDPGNVFSRHAAKARRSRIPETCDHVHSAVPCSRRWSAGPRQILHTLCPGHKKAPQLMQGAAGCCALPSTSAGFGQPLLPERNWRAWHTATQTLRPCCTGPAAGRHRRRRAPARDQPSTGPACLPEITHSFQQVLTAARTEWSWRSSRGTGMQLTHYAHSHRSRAGREAKFWLHPHWGAEAYLVHARLLLAGGACNLARLCRLARCRADYRSEGSGAVQHAGKAMACYQAQQPW